MTFSARSYLSLLVLMLLGVLVGCDSGDPIDDPGTGTTPVSGTYLVEAFSVTPDASRIPPLNLLDTLVLDETRLQLFEGGDFVFTYRYLGGPAAALLGRYTYSSRDVRLQADPTSSDLHDLRALLVNDQLTLQRSNEDQDLLSASFRKTVDMAALSDGYEGIPPIAATVQVRLRER